MRRRIFGERTFSYDANGNQMGWEHDRNGTRRTIVWDEENRIQSISDNGHTKTYKYNDAGQRVIKRGPQGETAYVNQFFVIRNREGGTKHIYAGKTRLVSKLMKQDKPGKNPNGKVPLEKDLYYYHPDHLGSSAYVSDTQGKLFQHLEYFPFGETFVEQSSNTQRTPYRFTAKEFDEETGLYYFGARYYDPRTSVWQSPDPVLLDILSDPKRLSELSKKLALYSYVSHNPVVRIDPDGRDWIKVTGGKVSWYAGKAGDTKKLVATYKATSGLPKHQQAKYDNSKDKGPTPSGRYSINLKPEPNRVAKYGKVKGGYSLVSNPKGGIEKIPGPFQEPWGKERAKLTPMKGTNTKGRGSFYFHDSKKGYTHGCIEVESKFFDRLKDYRKDGNKDITVIIKYSKPDQSTYGGTDIP